MQHTIVTRSGKVQVCDSKPEHIVARSITLVDENGKSGMSLTCDEETRGVWIDGQKKGEMIGIYSTPGQSLVITLAQTWEDGAAWQFAITLGEDNRPIVQYKGKDGLSHLVDLEALGK